MDYDVLIFLFVFFQAEDGIRDYKVTGVQTCALPISVMMGIVSLWPPLMRRLGVQSDILAGMGPFLNALNWGTLPLLLYFALRRYLQAVNMVKPVTFALVSSNIVNALFNWIFIYGHWGAPAYGIAGSGWSTCLARIY